MSLKSSDPIDEATLSDNVKEVLANLALEGIKPSPELSEDIKLLDAGKLTHEQFLERAIARAKS